VYNTQVLIGLAGLGSFIAAVVGGGFQVLGIQIPVLQWWARLVLAIVGPVLVLAAISDQILQDEIVELLDSKKNGDVNSPVTAPPEKTQFPVTEPFKITSIWDYHWNDGAGEAPGNISLQNSDGDTLGTWEVIAADRDAKLKNWEVKPNTWVTAGTYTIIDSESKTWSWNNTSHGHGMSRLKHIDLGGAG
jgi:hypothetical protein